MNKIISVFLGFSLFSASVFGGATVGLPPASTTVLGGITVDGTSITANASGQISVVGGSIPTTGTQLLAHAATTQTFTGNVDANVVFATVSHSSGITATSTTQFTIVTAGLYLITAFISNGGSPVTNFHTSIAINGSNIAANQGPVVTAQCSLLVRLVVNDVITISGGAGTGFTTSTSPPPSIGIVQLSL